MPPKRGGKKTHQAPSSPAAAKAIKKMQEEVALRKRQKEEEERKKLEEEAAAEAERLRMEKIRKEEEQQAAALRAELEREAKKKKHLFDSRKKRVALNEKIKKIENRRSLEEKRAMDEEAEVEAALPEPSAFRLSGSAYAWLREKTSFSKIVPLLDTQPSNNKRNTSVPKLQILVTVEGAKELCRGTLIRKLLAPYVPRNMAGKCTMEFAERKRRLEETRSLKLRHALALEAVPPWQQEDPLAQLISAKPHVRHAHNVRDTWKEIMLQLESVGFRNFPQEEIFDGDEEDNLSTTVRNITVDMPFWAKAVALDRNSLVLSQLLENVHQHLRRGALNGLSPVESPRSATADPVHPNNVLLMPLKTTDASPFRRHQAASALDGTTHNKNLNTAKTSTSSIYKHSTWLKFQEEGAKTALQAYSAAPEPLKNTAIEEVEVEEEREDAQDIPLSQEDTVPETATPTTHGDPRETTEVQSHPEEKETSIEEPSKEETSIEEPPKEETYSSCMALLASLLSNEEE